MLTKQVCRDHLKHMTLHGIISHTGIYSLKCVRHRRLLQELNVK